MFSKDLDASTALAGLFLLAGLGGVAFSFVVPNPYSRTLPLATAVAAGAFLVTRRQTVRAPGLALPPSLLGGLYFALVAASVVLYHGAGNHRTLPVHAALLGCYLIAALLVLTPVSRYVKLGTIVLTGVLQRALAYYSSPLYLGNDVFAHNRVVGEIVAANSMEPLSAGRYFYAPFYHLLVSVQQIVTGVSVRHAAFVTITVALVVIPAAALYLLTTRIWGERAAGFSVLLYTASDFALHWSLTPQVTSLGIALFALLFVLLVSYVRTGAARYHALYLVAFGAIALTHHLSTAIALLVVTIFLVIWAGYKPAFRRRAAWLVGVTGGMTLVDFQVTKFGGPGSGSESFLLTVVEIWQASLQEASLPGGSSSVLPADAGLALSGSAALNVWHVAGTAILFGLAVFGGLHWLSSRRVERTTGIALGAVVGLLFPTVLLGPVVGLRILIPWRWFAFLYVPLVLLAAPGVVVLANVARERIGRPTTRRSTVAAVLLVLVVVTPYIFLMGGNAIAARDGPPLDNAPGAERYGVTAAEAQALSDTARYVPEGEPVVGDFMMAHNILTRHYGLENARTIHMETGEPRSIGQSRPVYLFNRSYMQSGHVKFRYGTEQGIGDVPGVLVHGVVPVDDIDPERREVVYTTGEAELIRLAAAPTGSDNATTRVSDAD